MSLCQAMVVPMVREDVRAARRDCVYQSTNSATAYRTARVELTRIRYTAVSFYVTTYSVKSDNYAFWLYFLSVYVCVRVCLGNVLFSLFFSLLTHRVRDYCFVCAIGGQHDGHLPFWLPGFVKFIMLKLYVFVCIVEINILLFHCGCIVDQYHWIVAIYHLHRSSVASLS